MAALPTTSLTITQIKTALGTSENRLSYLCKHANVDPWARYKPGYLEGDGAADHFVEYQPPQGPGYTDPRGTNPDSGDTKESYRLGDFRGYDQVDPSPYVSFPSATIEFGSGTGTSFGIGVTFYAGDVEWDANGVYRAEPNWATMTHVHLLDADDDSFQGTAVLPAIGGNVTIDVSGMAMTQGVPITTTYHLAFGIDETHWSIKLGSRYGAGGIGDITILRLEPAEALGVTWDDTEFYGGANDPYDGVVFVDDTNTNRIVGTSAIWDYTAIDNFRCHYSHDGGGTDDYRNIKANWYIKGFKASPTTEYFAGNANFADNGANNTVTLPVSGSPSSFGDGDKIILILRDLSINF